MNGWQRLWLVLCVLYVVPVATVLYLGWPTPAQTHHREDFVTRMPADVQKDVIASYTSEFTMKQALKRLPQERSKKVTVAELDLLYAETIAFPNGAILLVQGQAARTSEGRFAKAYWDVVEAEVRAERRTMAWQMALVWLIPCLMLYALGWATAWVRRGFRHGASATTAHDVTEEGKR